RRAVARRPIAHTAVPPVTHFSRTCRPGRCAATLDGRSGELAQGLLDLRGVVLWIVDFPAASDATGRVDEVGAAQDPHLHLVTDPLLAGGLVRLYDPPILVDQEREVEPELIGNLAVTPLVVGRHPVDDGIDACEVGHGVTESTTLLAAA